jgi:hypothetical protein
MKDQLRDVVEHTLDTGVLDAVKIVGDEESTLISGVAEDRTVVVQGKFKKPVPEFIGTFGMPALGKVKVLLNIPEYRENAVISVVRQGDQPCGLKFENKSGDFSNTYRFMTADVVAEKLKTVKFKGVNWNVTFEPSAVAIQKFKFQSQANTEEVNFKVSQNDKELEFEFGDHSTHTGKFIFASNFAGKLTKSLYFPIKQFQSLLDSVGDKTISFSDEGVCQITVDSGISEMTYILLAMTK